MGRQGLRIDRLPAVQRDLVAHSACNRAPLHGGALVVHGGHRHTLGIGRPGIMGADIVEGIQRIAVEIFVVGHAGHAKAGVLDQALVANGHTGILGLRCARTQLEHVVIAVPIIGPVPNAVHIAGPRFIGRLRSNGGGADILGEEAGALLGSQLDGVGVIASAAETGINVVFVVEVAAGCPVGFIGGIAGIVEDIVLNVRAVTAVVTVVGGGILDEQEGVVVHLAIDGGSEIQRANVVARAAHLAVLIADVVAEHRIVRVPVTVHHAAAGVAGAVVVLVDGAVAVVGVPGLGVVVAVAAVHHVVALVVLEQGGLALPGPDAGRHIAFVVVGRGAIHVKRGLDLPGAPESHIVFNERLVVVHGGDGVAAHLFQVVVADVNLGRAVGLARLIRNRHGIHLVPIGCIRRRNAPAADPAEIAALNAQVVKPGNAGAALICRQGNGEVDAAVVHVLDVDVAVNFFDVQVLEIDMVDGARVLGHAGHAGAAHLAAPLVAADGVPVGGVVSGLSRNGAAVLLAFRHGDLGGVKVGHGLAIFPAVGHGKVLDLDVWHIVEVDTGGHVTVTDVVAVVQILAHILVPHAVAVGIDEGLSGAVIAVGVNDDGGVLRAAALNVEVLVLKDGAALQIDLRPGLEIQLVDLMEAVERGSLAGTIIAVAAVQRTDIVSTVCRGICANGSRSTHGHAVLGHRRGSFGDHSAYITVPMNSDVSKDNALSGGRAVRRHCHAGVGDGVAVRLAGYDGFPSGLQLVGPVDDIQAADGDVGAAVEQYAGRGVSACAVGTPSLLEPDALTAGLNHRSGGAVTISADGDGGISRAVDVHQADGSRELVALFQQNAVPGLQISPGHRVQPRQRCILREAAVAAPAAEADVVSTLARRQIGNRLKGLGRELGGLSRRGVFRRGLRHGHVPRVRPGGKRRARKQGQHHNAR